MDFFETFHNRSESVITGRFIYTREDKNGIKPITQSRNLSGDDIRRVGDALTAIMKQRFINKGVPKAWERENE